MLFVSVAMIKIKWHCQSYPSKCSGRACCCDSSLPRLRLDFWASFLAWLLSTKTQFQMGIWNQNRVRLSNRLSFILSSCFFSLCPLKEREWWSVRKSSLTQSETLPWKPYFFLDSSLHLCNFYIFCWVKMTNTITHSKCGIRWSDTKIGVLQPWTLTLYTTLNTPFLMWNMVVTS